MLHIVYEFFEFGRIEYLSFLLGIEIGSYHALKLSYAHFFVCRGYSVRSLDRVIFYHRKSSGVSGAESSSFYKIEHYGIEREKSQTVGDGGTGFTEFYGEFFLSKSEFVHQRPVRLRLFYGIEVFSLKVFDESYLRSVGFAEFFYYTRYGCKACYLACSESSLSCDEFESSVFRFRDQYGLYDSVILYACGKFFQSRLVEMSSRLIGICLDEIYLDVPYLVFEIRSVLYRKSEIGSFRYVFRLRHTSSLRHCTPYFDTIIITNKKYHCNKIIQKTFSGAKRSARKLSEISMIRKRIRKNLGRFKTVTKEKSLFQIGLVLGLLPPLG